MEKENNFKDTVNSLFKGMDGFVSAKTVVGDAIHVGDTIILPLVDVSFGVGAGAFEGDKKNNCRKDVSLCSTCDPEWKHQTCKRKKSGWPYQGSGYGAGFCEPFCTRCRQCRGYRRERRVVFHLDFMHIL